MFYHRAISYISIINSSMILFILLDNLEKHGITINIKQWFFPIVIIGILGLVFIGYLEDKLGFYKAEQEKITQRNPQITEILEKIKLIEQRIK